ncbi:MAG TPA: CDP-diacylglycerol--glycerol-3-phosphate 3-phosphatidyltransferase [candidate division Zixibacteria bacterium]|nr:CDP-diacylglycerol--glycerol-3-phosphate 3-phosphatidyltransferase [candidate division Zixibacteria bacterium]
MNLPNQLTLARIVLAFVFVGFFLVDSPWAKTAALAVFLAAAWTDLYDGYLARKTGVVTGFGKFMDPLADKVLVSSALISFVALGYIKAWIVVVIIFREFMVTGLRLLAAYKGIVIVPSVWAQIKTVLEMTTIALILLFTTLKIWLVPNGHHWAIFSSDWTFKSFNGLVFLAMLLSVATGIDYLVKNAPLLRGVLK